MKYVKNLLIILGMTLIISGCGKVDSAVDTLWTEAETYRSNEDLKSCIEKLTEIIEKYPQHKRAADAQFMVGDIYLNDVRDFEIALAEFKNVVEKFPKSDVAEKALFMMGYVNANNLQAYSDGINYYREFLEKYPDSELVPSVKYELDNLKSIEEEIEKLNEVAVNNQQENDE